MNDNHETCTTDTCGWSCHVEDGAPVATLSRGDMDAEVPCPCGDHAADLPAFADVLATEVVLLAAGPGAEVWAVRSVATGGTIATFPTSLNARNYAATIASRVAAAIAAGVR